jgi:hypothetical protein
MAAHLTTSESKISSCIGQPFDTDRCLAMKEEDNMRITRRAATALALSLVIMIGAAMSGCSRGQAHLEMPTVELVQYQKGTTGDLDDATLNQTTESFGASNYRYGLAATVYPSYYYSTAARDAMARVTPSIGSPYKFGDNVTPTTYAQLTANDKSVVDGRISTALDPKEQDAVADVIMGFLARVNADMAAAKAPVETSAYGVLKQSVSEAAANSWANDVTAGGDYADRFFVCSIKQYMTIMPSAFEPFWLGLGYPGIPSSPSDAEIEMVARIAGETNFVNSIASTMYPTQAGQQAQAMYGKTYGALSLFEAPYVNAAVYAGLPSAFGTGATADTLRAGVRQVMTTNLKNLYNLSTDNYATLKGMEKALVDQAIFQQLDAKDSCGNYAKPLGFGPHLERDYIDFAAVPGAVLGWGAELAPAVPMNQNLAYLTIESGVDTTSAIGWMKDVTAGVSPSQAFYRWLAKEQMSEMSAIGSMVQVSVQEFYFKVTNSNGYDVSLDSLSLDFQVKASTGESIGVARQASGDKIWIPAKTAVIIRILAPVKTLDVISLEVLGGKDSGTAQMLASDVWSKIQTGQAEWDVVVETAVSNSSGTQTETYAYALQWPSS